MVLNALGNSKVVISGDLAELCLYLKYTLYPKIKFHF